MGSIKFNKANGRQKRALPGEDHYTGLVVYSPDIPAGFDTAEVEATPEVKAQATATVTNIGANADYVWLYAIDPAFDWVLLAVYQKVADDDTLAKVATAIAAAINAKATGYTANAVGAVVTITARPGLGDSLSTALYISKSTGATIAITGSNFAGGADPELEDIPAESCKAIADVAEAEELGITVDAASIYIRIMHYHIKEAFRLNPDMVFYLGIFPVPAGAHDFDEVDALRIFAQNKLRQVGVWTPKAYSQAHFALLQDQYDKAFEVYAPFEIYYAANLASIATGDMPTLSGLTAPNVHLLIGQDGEALGAELFAEAGKSIGVVGAKIGAVSLAAVNENTAWVEKFQMAVPGGELDVPALSNGVLVSTLSNNIVKSGGTFDTKRLIFLKKYPNISGTYFNDTHGAVSPDDDYAYAEDNRAMDKAIRGVYVKLIPRVNGPSLYTKEKKLDPAYVSFLQTEAGKALEEMEKAGELSGYTVVIDPEQDSYNTDTITVGITNIKRGVSRNFIINIGF